jgi:hypothetical protein
MGLCAIHVGFYARDLLLERLDALVELVDRQRIEILLLQLLERILRLVRKEFVEVHWGKLTHAMPESISAAP